MYRCTDVHRTVHLKKEISFRNDETQGWEVTTRANDSQETPTQSHISPSILAYEVVVVYRPVNLPQGMPTGHDLAATNMEGGREGEEYQEVTTLQYFRIQLYGYVYRCTGVDRPVYLRK